MYASEGQLLPTKAIEVKGLRRINTMTVTARAANQRGSVGCPGSNGFGGQEEKEISCGLWIWHVSYQCAKKTTNKTPMRQIWAQKLKRKKLHWLL